MKVLAKTEFQEILFHEELGAFEERFTKESSQIFGRDYIREVSLFGETVINHQPKESPYKKIIINTIAGGPTMEPIVQEFMHTKFYPMLAKSGITHKAYCLGPEIIAKLSVELTADDDPDKQFDYKFFTTLEEGIEWLKRL